MSPNSDTKIMRSSFSLNTSSYVNRRHHSADLTLEIYFYFLEICSAVMECNKSKCMYSTYSIKLVFLIVHIRKLIFTIYESCLQSFAQHALTVNMDRVIFPIIVLVDWQTIGNGCVNVDGSIFLQMPHPINWERQEDTMIEAVRRGPNGQFRAYWLAYSRIAERV